MTDPTVPAAAPADFWEERYAGSDRVWSGAANAVLVYIAAELEPGRALDLGCGEGADAIWLAQHGWTTTAVDISETAIARARAAASHMGLAEDQVRFSAADLSTWTDDGEYDLVTASFLHSPVALSRTDILRRAAGRVAPGGHLLVVAHATPPPWSRHRHDRAEADARNPEHTPPEFPTPEEELSALALDETAWTVVFAEIRRREATGPDGTQAMLDDSVLLLQRRPD